MTIKLSICIPSYNRAKFLPDLLHSIVSQYDERVEIVISDNGSIDNTESLVRSYQKKFPRIVYERFAKNVGPDRCFMRSVELGSGVFCWLMGDDDIIEEGGIQRVLNALQDDLTGITLNRIAYDPLLKRKWMEPSVTGLQEDIFFKDASKCFSSLFLLLGFLSAQVVKKSAWMAVVEEEDVSLYFNAYVLVYIMGRMIQKEPCWLYIHTPYVGWRSGNDSFAAELGRFRRFKLDVVSYGVIIKALFASQKPLYRQVLRKVVLVHFLGHIRDLKFTSKGFVFKSFAVCLPRLYNVGAFWTHMLPFLCVPRCILLLLRKLLGFKRFFLGREKDHFWYTSIEKKGAVCKEKGL